VHVNEYQVICLPQRYPEDQLIFLSKFRMSAKKLTRAAIERVKPNPNKRREIPDGLVPGLYLILQPSGKKSWAVRYRAYGKPKKLTLGPYPVLGLVDAREKARDALLIKDKGDDPALVMERERALQRVAAKNTFEAVVAEFIERYAKPKNRTWSETERIFKRYVTPEWGARPLHSITRRDVVCLLDRIEDHSGIHMANRVLAAIRKLFNWSMSRGTIHMSPIGPGMARGVETRRDRILSDEELTALWRSSEAESYPFGPFIQIIALTGQRLREVSGMKWSDIEDLEGKEPVWTLSAQSTKSKRVHRVPLPRMAARILKSVPKFDKQDLVFSTNGKTPISGFSRFKRRLDQKSVVNDWRFHDLRRTLATGLRRLGEDRLTVSKILNHADPDITGVYDRYTADKEKRRALNKWARHIESLISDTSDRKVVKLHG